MNEVEKQTYIKNAVRGLTFEHLKILAKDDSLTTHEKIGFINEQREGYGDAIFADIITKLPAINQRKKKIADIGCGCDELAYLIIKRCVDNENSLCLIDSQEMLDLLPPSKNVEKIAGKFPIEFENFIANEKNTFDAIIVYSVIHAVSLEDSVFNFID